jgi:thiol:disulfide interchange protein DsbC
MSRYSAMAISALIGLAAGAAYGSEADIRRGVQARFPDIAIESVTKTPFSGIYEVVLGGRIVYTDEKVNFIFIGNLLDTRGTSERDLTRERSAQLTIQTLRESTNLAIKRVRGNGRRVLYTFEDPNCGFCKELQKELTKVTDITIFTFLWPILSADSVAKSRSVWCAKDRGKAWDELMSRGTVPQNDGKCDTPLEKNMELARRFRVNGTPALFFADGTMIGGYVPAEKLEQALGAASPK